jgi:processive 1,2-diacylglycerol beta-glucosyltransferase
MIIIDPLPGQEEWNADVVAGAGAGIQLRMPETVPPAALHLLNQPERLAAMAAQARAVGKPEAALDVARSILGDLHGE